MRSSYLPFGVAVSIALVVASQLGAGCSTIVKHGKAPRIPRAPVFDHCIASQQIQLVEGSAKLRGLNQSTVMSPRTNGLMAITSFNAGPSAPTTHLTGYTPFLGRNRLSPQQAIEKLKSPVTQQAYQESLAPYAGGKWRATRPLWIGLLVGGGTLMVAGMVSANRGFAEPDPDQSTAYYLLGGSVLALLASLPFVYLDLTNHDNSNQLAARRELFILDAPLADSLDRALFRFNGTIRERCQGSY